MNAPIYAGDSYALREGLTEHGRKARVLEVPARGFITLRWIDSAGLITLTAAQFDAMFEQVQS